MITYSQLSQYFSDTNTRTYWYQEGVYAYNWFSGSEWAYHCKPDGTYEVATLSQTCSLREKAIAEDSQLLRMVISGEM